MGIYQIPRNVKGEGRILYIFTTKSLIYSVAGAIIGLLFYFIFNNIFNLKIVGIVILVCFAAIGYGIAMLKVPESNRYAFFKKVGGEKIDEIIIRAFKFKQKGKRIYIQETKEESK